VVHGVSYVVVNNPSVCPVLKMLGLEDLLQELLASDCSSVQTAVAGK
jgi:hypothetical protein